MSMSAFDIESDKGTSTNDIESPITTTHDSKRSQEDNWITVGGKKIRSKTWNGVDMMESTIYNRDYNRSRPIAA